MIASQVRGPWRFGFTGMLSRARRLQTWPSERPNRGSASAQKVEKRKSSGVAVLPGKLTDCESTDLARNEIFLVEGDSAGGSAKNGPRQRVSGYSPLEGEGAQHLGG